MSAVRRSDPIDPHSADLHAPDSHLPVMLDEVLRATPASAREMVDGTYGRGGHSRALLGKFADDFRLHVFDRDQQAVASAGRLAERDPRVTVHAANYAEIDQSLATESVDAVLLDLGVSSPQLDQAERGFSFMQDGPLDMRMDQSREPSAQTWLRQNSETELLRVLREYGEEPDAKRVSKAIFAARDELSTTKQLADLVQSIKGRGKPGRHPATQVFQALRMAVNQELPFLHAGLNASFRVLRKGGVLLIISFHSLEDRVVKNFLAERAKPPAASRRDFMAAADFQPSLKLLGKLQATESEQKRNPRSRSAVLRIAEKLI